MWAFDALKDRKTLVINGNAGDTLDLLETVKSVSSPGDATNWSVEGAFGIKGTFRQDFGAGLKTYNVYYVNVNSPGQASLYVDNTMTVI